MLLICTLSASKVAFIHFYLNGRLNAVSIGKPSERMSNFCTVRFLKTKSIPNFGFMHIPNGRLHLKCLMQFERYSGFPKFYVVVTCPRAMPT